MEPRAADFDHYVKRTLALLGRVPMSVEQASRRVALEMDLGVAAAAKLRDTVQGRVDEQPQ